MTTKTNLEPRVTELEGLKHWHMT